MSWIRRKFPSRTRTKCQRDNDSITSSSDDDGPRRQYQKGRASCGAVRSSLQKAPFSNPGACSCFLIYLLFGLLLLGFLYWYGAHLLAQIMRLIRLLLQPFMMKSATDIVQEALAKYSADKVGMADYALESAGGTVLCNSDTFYAKTGAVYSLFGVPLWYHTSSPREVIQPDVQPGKCWAMDGTQGFVTIKLAMPVVVNFVSLEHIPKEVAPSGRLDSAPKDFLITGQEHTLSSPEVFLGSFQYVANSSPIQVFEIKDPDCLARTMDPSSCDENKRRFRIITLKIKSNYGNHEYTCLYRLRVHGKP